MAAKDDDTIRLVEPVQLIKNNSAKTVTITEDSPSEEPMTIDENVPSPVHEEHVSPKPMPRQTTPPPSARHTIAYETAVEPTPVRQPSPPPKSPSPPFAAEPETPEPTNEEPSFPAFDPPPEGTVHADPIKELSMIAEDDEVIEHDDMEVQEATTSVPSQNV